MNSRPKTNSLQKLLKLEAKDISQTLIKKSTLFPKNQYKTFLINSKIHPRGQPSPVKVPHLRTYDSTMSVFRSKSDRSPSIKKIQPSIGQYDILFRSIEPHAFQAQILSKTPIMTHNPHQNGEFINGLNNFQSSQKTVSFTKQISRMQAQNYRSWAPNLYENELKQMNNIKTISTEEIEKRAQHQFTLHQNSKRNSRRSDLYKSCSQYQPPMNKDEIRVQSLKIFKGHNVEVSNRKLPFLIKERFKTENKLIFDQE